MSTSGAATPNLASAYGCIYVAINTVNGNLYVGQTKTSISARWIKHKSDARTNKDTPFCAAIRKYGDTAFSIEVVAAGADREELNELEIHYIEKLKPVYNCTSGGGGLGAPTPEVRAKIAKAMQGRVFSEETRRRISDGIRGRKLSEESRAKLSTSLRRRAAEKAEARGPKPKRVRKPYVSPNESLFVDEGLTTKADKLSFLAKHEYFTGKRKKLCGPANPVYGRNLPPETVVKYSEMFSGTGNPFYGKRHGVDTKAKMAEAHANRPKVCCPHCDKVGAHNAMQRWHFNNCRVAAI